MRNGSKDPKINSRMVVFILAQAFKISPLEVYKMPKDLVDDMLLFYFSSEELKNQEMEKMTKKHKM